MSYGVFRHRFDPVLYRRTPWVPTRALAGQTVAVDQVVETDTAQAIARQKLKAVGQVTETDTAQAINRQKVRALGQVIETDTVQAISWSPKRRLINQVIEIDTAQPVIRGGAVLIPEAPATGGAAPWHTEAWRKKKYTKIWELPEPAFPLQTPTEVTPLPKEKPQPSISTNLVAPKPRQITRGLVYRPYITPTPNQPVRYTDIQARELEAVEVPTIDEAQRKRQRSEDELIIMMVAQGVI